MGRRKRRDAGRPRGAPVIEAVLAQTLAELASHGLEGLSVDRIARRARVNKTSIYRRWPDRDRLVAAALEGIATEVAAVVPDTGSLSRDLLGLLQPLAQFFNQPLGAAVLSAVVAHQGTRVAALGADRIAQSGAVLQAVVTRAAARGEWRAGVDGRQVVFALVGAVIHRCLLERAPADPAWLEALVDLTVEGVRPRAAVSKRRRPSPRSRARSGILQP